VPGGLPEVAGLLVFKLLYSHRAYETVEALNGKSRGNSNNCREMQITTPLLKFLNLWCPNPGSVSELCPRQLLA
jgi:hypothetical protein